MQNIQNVINSGLTYDFSDSNYNIETLNFTEGNYGIIERTVKNLTKNNISVTNFYATRVDDTADLSYFLDENGKCNWIETLTLSRKEYGSDLWTSQHIFDELGKMSSSSIKKLSVYYCGKTNLDFIQNFETLKSLTFNNSKIVDISGLEPKIDEDGSRISGFPSLEEFTLISPIGSSPTDISVFEKIPTLKKLNVSGTNVNKGIEALANLTNLEYLNLNNCSSLSQNRKLCKFS